MPAILPTVARERASIYVRVGPEPDMHFSKQRLYSITSSASRRNESEIMSPIAFAAFRFTISS
jgi:hypothetical protein